MAQQVLNFPAKKREEVPDALIFKCADIYAALRMEIATSEWDDKQVSMELGFPASNFSDMLTGKRNLPLDKLVRLMEFCGGNVLLRWLAYQANYEVKPMQSALEKAYMQLQDDYDAVVRLLKKSMAEGGAQ